MFIKATITSPTGIVRIITDAERQTTALRATPGQLIIADPDAVYISIRAVTWASLSAWERRDITY